MESYELLWKLGILCFDNSCLCIDVYYLMTVHRCFDTSMAAVSIGKSAHVAYGMLILDNPVHASSDAHRTPCACWTSHK